MAEPMKVWHVTIPAIALVAADSAEDAEREAAAHLEQAGFHPYEDGRRVFESEPVEPDTHFQRTRKNLGGWRTTPYTGGPDA